MPPVLPKLPTITSPQKQKVDFDEPVFPASGIAGAIWASAVELKPRPGYGGGLGEGTWQLFVFPTGRFKVKLPARPTQEPRNITIAGQTLPATLLFTTHGRQRYEIIYADLPKAAKDSSSVDKLYDNVRDKFIKLNSLTQSTETPFAAGGFTGRELYLEKDTLGVRVLFLLVERRLYQLVILSRYRTVDNKFDKEYLERKARQLFDSFKFVPEGEEDLLTKGAAVAFENADFTGQSRGQNYQSDYFGLQLATIPEEWKPDGYGQTGHLFFATSPPKVHFLFLVGKKGITEPQPIYPFFLFGVEQLPEEDMTAAAYLELSKLSLTKTSLEAKFKGPVKTEKIGGADFASLEMETQQNGSMAQNKVFVTIARGVALFIVLQAVSVEDMNSLQRTIQLLQIDQSNWR